MEDKYLIAKEDKFMTKIMAEGKHQCLTKGKSYKYEFTNVVDELGRELVIIDDSGEEHLFSENAILNFFTINPWI